MSSNFAGNDGKVAFVSTGSDVTKRRGKGIGFYCPACDLTFKDSIQYVDHIHSRQHLAALDQPLKVSRATLEDVRARINLLAARIDRPYNIRDAIKIQKQREAEEKQNISSENSEE